jgi:hypothetical protein
VSAARRLLRDASAACSAPEAFFRDLAQRSAPQPWRAVLVAVVAVTMAFGTLSLAFVRGTDSEGFLLVWAVALAVALPYLALVLLLGGLVMVRPTALDLRAWEIAGWAWAPAGALALSLLPVAILFPAVAAAAGLLAFPVWHMVVVLAGLKVMAPRSRALAAGLYLLAVFLVPGVVTFGSFAILSAA